MSDAVSPEDRLAEYRSKRDSTSTPEPFGGNGAGGPLVFVVQKHAARRTHYDLRLEMDDVLRSWAVPQGPSLDPTVKRLAVRTEDHPMEYSDFEGVIPEGNYGAGPMIVWDRGRYVPLPVTEKEEKEGKLLFELFGHKLRGVWTLFPTNREKREWLLLKKPDAWARGEDEHRPAEESVLSGLTVEQLGEGQSATDRVRDEIAELDLPPLPDEPTEIRPMLAEHREDPFTDPDWTFELKYDGFRLLATRGGDDPRLTYRSGLDATRIYPDVARALLSLATDSILLDGEVVVLDEDGRPSFQRLQRRAHLTRRLDIQRGTLEHPATYYAFDLLAFEGLDLRSLPLRERKRLLAQLVPRLGIIRFADGIDRQGEALYEQIRSRGLEGIMAKRLDSPYQAGRRCDDWYKIRSDRKEAFTIIGFRPPKGQSVGVGALHVATEREDGWIYAGRVGSGFTEAIRNDLETRFADLATEEYPLDGDPPAGKGNHWLRPELRCEVRYKEWTAEENLRHPVFLGLLDDASTESPPPPTVRRSGGERPPNELRLSNLDKVFWPDQGFTKGDLIEHYRRVAPLMLPYLRDRPLVLDRYPDGIDGKSFYQKNAPDHAPEWIPTIGVWSGDPPKAIEYFVCNDETTLLYLANLGAIPFHLWASRTGSLDRPDWSIIDLDPKEAPFAHVVALARAVRELCQEIELPSFVKTSGSTGLHVLVPLGGSCDYTQSRLLAELLSRVINSRYPEISTLIRNPAARSGRVYLDYLQNRRGQLLVAPYSLRPLPGAPVSAPLRWEEVDGDLSIGAFSITSMPKRLAELGEDPLSTLLDTTPDLSQTLRRLSVLIG